MAALLSSARPLSAEQLLTAGILLTAAAAAEVETGTTAPART